MHNPDMIEENFEERKEEKARYEGLARIALPRFSELQRGEHIGSKEILIRLNAIQESGYSVGKGYKKMDKGELWDLLKETRIAIRIKANEYCPDVVREIDKRNRTQIRERGLF